MKNQYYKESNAMAVSNQRDKNQGYNDVYIRREQGECYSLWKANFFERLKFLFFGRIWIKCKSGETQPPMIITTDYFPIKDWEKKAFTISRPVSRQERRRLKKS